MNGDGGGIRLERKVSGLICEQKRNFAFRRNRLIAAADDGAEINRFDSRSGKAGFSLRPGRTCFSLGACGARGGLLISATGTNRINKRF